MEVQPIVKHQSADKRVERKSQPADEMREEHHPLMRLGGGDDLPLGQKPVGDFWVEVPRLSQLRNVLLCDGGGHPLAMRSGSGHGWSAFLRRKRWELGHWSSRMDGQRERRRR